MERTSEKTSTAELSAPATGRPGDNSRLLHTLRMRFCPRLVARTTRVQLMHRDPYLLVRRHDSEEEDECGLRCEGCLLCTPRLLVASSARRSGAFAVTFSQFLPFLPIQ
jgi:hypothetical protein